MTAGELNDLISKHGKNVYNFCCNLTGDRMEAEDLYQDTFLKAVELCHKLEVAETLKDEKLGKAFKQNKEEGIKTVIDGSYEVTCLGKVSGESMCYFLFSWMPRRQILKRQRNIWNSLIRSGIRKKNLQKRVQRLRNPVKI